MIRSLNGSAINWSVNGNLIGSEIEMTATVAMGVKIAIALLPISTPTSTTPFAEAAHLWQSTPANW